MKIFLLNETTDSKIIGRSFPQIIDSDCERLFDENGKRKEEDKFIDISDVDFTVKISKSVKLTDVLSSFMTVNSRIVSERFVEFLQRFKIPAFRLVPIKIVRQKEIVIEKKYYILHFTENDIANVDFEKSEFEYLSGGAFYDKSLLKFKNFEDYWEKINRKDFNYAIVKRLIMKPTLQNDLFFLGVLEGSAACISSRLKESIEAENISGVKFEEFGYVED